MVDSFEDVLDVVVDCSYSVEPFFCSGGGEFVVAMDVHGVWLKGIETSAGREFVGRAGCCIVGKLCERCDACQQICLSWQ